MIKVRAVLTSVLYFSDVTLQCRKNITIPGSADLPIVLDVFFKENGEPKPVVIFVHGFKGFKDWGHFNQVAEKFAEEGFVFIKFNFSHNGTTVQDPLNFGDLEAFGKNNYIIELDDLKLVIDWTLNTAWLRPELDQGRLSLLGHSRGGGISIIKAFEDKRVNKLVTWASVSTFVNRNKKKTIETWKRDGVVYAHNARTQQEMPMYRQFYDIMMANKSRLNLLACARKLKIPFLIVHGTNDEAVPFAEAEALHQSAHSSRLFRVENADHTFGVRHPFLSYPLPPRSVEVVDQTIHFLRS